MSYLCYRPLGSSDVVTWYVAYTAANSISHVTIRADNASLCDEDMETVGFMLGTISKSDIIIFPKPLKMKHIL